ncbi:MAG: hypothetical protein IPN17_20345 [Deltaproteobacteria bacterium]|nr:hypothetical protein [Deltaproteobacteria bacterium]
MTKRKPTEQTTAASMKGLALGLVNFAKGRAGSERGSTDRRVARRSDGDWDARWGRCSG